MVQVQVAFASEKVTVAEKLEMAREYGNHPYKPNLGLHLVIINSDFHYGKLFSTTDNKEYITISSIYQRPVLCQAWVRGFILLHSKLKFIEAQPYTQTWEYK